MSVVVGVVVERVYVVIVVAAVAKTVVPLADRVNIDGESNPGE